jgi:hypothetical protein
MHPAERLIWVCFLLLLHLPFHSAAAALNNNSTLSGPTRLSASTVLQFQWRNPNDVLSILLIMGGDVILKALAQLSGGFLVPVAFSFGWVSYSVSALLSSVGDGCLMPSDPDYPSILVNAGSGHVRRNNSWILGRILRDVESRQGHHDAALTVSVFNASGPAGVPIHDWLWHSGLTVILIQFIVAIIPWMIHQNWTVPLITTMGTLLALGGGALPQWQAEKWTCRRNSKGIYSLTRGNGHRHVVVIKSNGVGLNLEDLAIGRVHPAFHTRIALGILACLWIAFLVTVAGLKEDAWYIFFIGCIGMGQNIIVAAAPRNPSAFGIHLEHIKDIRAQKVMQVLKDTETEFPRVGASLLNIFFPGGLRDDERIYWQSIDNASSCVPPANTSPASASTTTVSPPIESQSTARQRDIAGARPVLNAKTLNELGSGPAASAIGSTKEVLASAE